MFGTLLEFALLICLEKQVFEAQIKKALADLTSKRKSSKRGNDQERNGSLRKNNSVPSMMERATSSLSGSPLIKQKSKSNGFNIRNGIIYFSNIICYTKEII